MLHAECSSNRSKKPRWWVLCIPFHITRRLVDSIQASQGTGDSEERSRLGNAEVAGESISPFLFIIVSMTARQTGGKTSEQLRFENFARLQILAIKSVSPFAMPSHRG
jgi:hypothetical protein